MIQNPLSRSSQCTDARVALEVGLVRPIYDHDDQAAPYRQRPERVSDKGVRVHAGNIDVQYYYKINL